MTVAARYLAGLVLILAGCSAGAASTQPSSPRPSSPTPLPTIQGFETAVTINGHELHDIPREHPEAVLAAISTVVARLGG